MIGTVESVTTDWRGDTLTAAVTSSATVLTVEDTTDFDENGGWLVVADSAAKQYLSVNHDAATVTLAATVGAAYEVGDPVTVWDPSVPGGAKVVEYVATVMTDYGPMDAVVSHGMIPAAGADSMVGASVTLVEGEDDWYVGQVPGREPVLDLSYADTGVGGRWVFPTITDPDAILGYSAIPQEAGPAVIGVAGVAGVQAGVSIDAPQLTGVSAYAHFQMITSTDNTSRIDLTADIINTTGQLLVSNGISGTMTTGSVGTSTFRDSVRAAALDYAQAWTTYTPTWTAATTNPVIGNGSITGRYARIGRNTIKGIIVLTVGSTTTVGVGNYDFGLPVAARALEEVVVNAIQTAPARNYTGRCPTTTSAVRLFLTSDFSAASNTTTGLISGSILRIDFCYEAA